MKKKPCLQSFTTTAKNATSQMQYIINTDLYLSLVFTSESNQILYTVLRLEKEKSNTVRNIL